MQTSGQYNNTQKVMYTLMVASTLVGSKLDYCNYICRSPSAADLNMLQCYENSLAQIVFKYYLFKDDPPLFTDSTMFYFVNCCTDIQVFSYKGFPK